jgi:hypothetical protein
MYRMTAAALLCAVSFAAISQQPSDTRGSDKSWISRSNDYTNMVLDVQLEHSPEGRSQEGLSKFDGRISNPTLSDELAERRELEAVVAKLKAAQTTEADKRVREDLQILSKALDLRFREDDFGIQHEVPFVNASETIFQGLRGLLDDQVAADRKPAAIIRLRKYSGTEPGYKPFTELLKQRELEQIAKPSMIYPSKDEVETELGRNSNYVDGIAALFKKYKLTGWEDSYAKLKTELTDYDAWVRVNILTKARTDFRMPLWRRRWPRATGIPRAIIAR